MDKETIKKTKEAKYTLMCFKEGLLPFYFCDDEKTLYRFINARGLKFDEYNILVQKREGLKL